MKWAFLELRLLDEKSIPILCRQTTHHVKPLPNNLEFKKINLNWGREWWNSCENKYASTTEHKKVNKKKVTFNNSINSAIVPVLRTCLLFACSLPIPPFNFLAFAYLFCFFCTKAQHQLLPPSLHSIQNYCQKPIKSTIHMFIYLTSLCCQPSRQPTHLSHVP